MSSLIGDNNEIQARGQGVDPDIGAFAGLALFALKREDHSTCSTHT